MFGTRFGIAPAFGQTTDLYDRRPFERQDRCRVDGRLELLGAPQSGKSAWRGWGWRRYAGRVPACVRE
jgi:hypothetical protein